MQRPVRARFGSSESALEIPNEESKEARCLIASDCVFGEAGASIQRRAARRGGLATQRVFTVEKSWKYERSTNQWH
jgi:hypothetical protein